jgi:hypothetical protein
VDTDDLERLAEPDERRLVQLQPDGRFRVPSADARAVLRERLGRAELLPTGPGWTLLRDLDGGEGASLPAEREVVCSGTLTEQGISLIDFVGFLATGYQSGVVTVAAGEVERSVFLHQGDVVWAASTDPGDRLGAFLLRRGKITRDQLQTAIRRGGETRIGRACVECGYIAAHELWAVVQAQLTEIFDQMLRTETGIWTFSRISSEALAESRIHLSTQGLLVDALRRLDEMKVFRQTIRSSDVLVERGPMASGPPPALPEIPPQQVELLLHQLPRAATVHELMRHLGKSEYEVTRLVHHMAKAGLVELVQPEGTGPVPRRADHVSLEGAQEVVDVYSMAIQEMVRELSAVRRGDALLQAAAAFIEDPTQTHTRVLSSVRLDPDGRIAGPPPTAASVEELNEALTELLFFLLFQATDLLGHKKGDDLARRVKVILALLSQESEA